MTDHRTAVVRARVTAAEHADWQAEAAAAGVSPSRLLRQAMARTRPWTAAVAEVERTRQVARIGNNLNQIARWANSQAAPIRRLSLDYSVRRDKAPFRSGCESRPATVAPAGSSRSGRWRQRHRLKHSDDKGPPWAVQRPHGRAPG